MSLSSTSTVKAQLTNALGPKAPPYFHVLKEYLAGRISRNEYDDEVKIYLDSVPLREYPSSPGRVLLLMCIQYTCIMLS